MFLFNVGTEDLEDDYVGGSEHSLPLETETAPLVGAQTSSPLRASSNPFVFHTASPITGGGEGNYEMLPNVVNAPSGIRGLTETVWRGRPVSVSKYIDDALMTEKVNARTQPLLQIDGKLFKDIHAAGVQGMFGHIVGAATAKGMVVNDKKTKMICISDSTVGSTQAHIWAGGEKIESDKVMRVLGFDFSDKPNVHAHVQGLAKRLRARIWALRDLRRAKLSQKDLVKFFNATIRPVAEYMSVVFHSMATEADARDLERQQIQALKNIFGCSHRESWASLRKKGGMEELETRRKKACLKFIKKAKESDRFKKWFRDRPPRPGLRSRRPLWEEIPKTDRRRNSPLLFMIRMLNDELESAPT